MRSSSLLEARFPDVEQRLGKDLEVLDGESLRLRVHPAELQQRSSQVAIPIVQRLHGHADGAGEGGRVVAERRVLSHLVERRCQFVGRHLNATA